jgi:putative PLP-dependent aminotransferase (TIGR04422 family)
VQERNPDGLVVEDAVDSMLLPGGSLFPANGRYEIWSLTKILGTAGGGVLWCRDADTGRRMRQLRDQRKSLRSLRWLLRFLSERMPALGQLWSEAESLAGTIPPWALGHISAAIDHWDEFAEARKQRLDVLADLRPGWLPAQTERLPVAVPVSPSESEGKLLSNLGFVQGFRHFERIDADGRRENVRVFPIPVHHKVPISVLERARDVFQK